jgi:primase-polymerase (primpol)-like protein
MIPDVPDSLGELDQWILWAYEFVPGKDEAQKIPYSARTRRKCDHTDSHVWASFSYCCSVYRRFPFDFSGLGFEFTASDPHCGVDLDDCLDVDRNPKPWARPILERFADTYMEVSPSNDGIKVFCKGEVPKGIHVPVHDGAIGLYSSGRFFAVTGNRWRNAPLEIEDHSADVRELFRRLNVSYETNGNHPGAGKWAINPDVNGSIPKGQRHDFLVSLAGTLHRRRLFPEIIETCLLQVNEKMCDPPRPYTDDEIRKIVKDSLTWQ